MCALCGDGRRVHATSITERPRQLLGGIFWSGSFGEASSGGAIDSAIAAVSGFAVARKAMWKSPIVGLSRNDRTDGFDYFAGVAVEAGEALPEGFATLELAEGVFASSWHGPEDGDVVEHYARMIEWLRGSAYRRLTAPFHSVAPFWNA